MYMELDITSKVNNVLLNRTEVRFTIIHDKSGTPKRELIRGELAEKMNSKKENVVIEFIDTEFGKMKTHGYAKIYPSVEIAKACETNYLLKRNNLPTKKKRKGKEGAAEAKGEAKKEAPAKSAAAAEKKEKP